MSNNLTTQLNGYLAKFDGTATTKVALGTTYDQPFGNKATVIIHKGGAAGVYKGRYQSLCDFYDKQTVTFTDGAQIDYLKPTDK